jgi:dihydrofolate reductase
MRTLVAYELLSLDGVAESPDAFFGWDDALDANLADVIAPQETVLLGRRSYDEWAPYWPTSDLEPFASFINDVPKFVATSSPLDPPWSNSSAIDGDPVAFVRALKEGPGGTIGVHASISLVQSLLAAGLVDELRLVVAPAVAGAGRRLLDGTPAHRLQLLDSATSPTGHLVLRYGVGGLLAE